METINLIKIGERLGVTFYNGAISAECLLDNCNYPTYDPYKKGIINGYQREQKDVNVAAVAERTIAQLNDFDAFVDNINGNIRSSGIHKTNVKPLDPKKTEDGDVYIFEYDPEEIVNSDIWTVDGQTRVKGLYLARSDAEGSKNWKKAKEINSKRIGINKIL